VSEPLRFYGELARWWPLVSPVEDYAEEATFTASVLRDATGGPLQTLLELGSGGGHVAWHLGGLLPGDVSMTLVDVSPEMLEVSRARNAGAEHLAGDMRDLRLGRSYDAVLVHDAIDYMTSEDELRAALTTAYVHCRPGGGAVFVPDRTRETFEEEADHGGSDAPEGHGVRFLEWAWDPDPDDSWFLVEYAFVLREADGRVRSVHETHRCGVFDLATWLRLLTEVGFEPETVDEETTEDRVPRTFFVGRRPEP